MFDNGPCFLQVWSQVIRPALPGLNTEKPPELDCALLRTLPTWGWARNAVWPRLALFARDASCRGDAGPGIQGVRGKSKKRLPSPLPRLLSFPSKISHVPPPVSCPSWYFLTLGCWQPGRPGVLGLARQPHPGS